MRYRCSCGNESKSNWNNFQKGKRCQECLRKKRSGPSNYQWREDREYIVLRKRYCCVACRVQKQTGVKTDLSISNCDKYFGYTFDQFCEFIKSSSAYSPGGDWVIDHIYPVWAFTESGITDLKLINGLDNLRVLSETENQKKCYKFDPLAFVRWVESRGVKWKEM